MLWALPTLTTACFVVCSLYYFFSRHSASPRPALRLCEAAIHASFDAAPLQQLRMALTLGAVVWLLHRSWQTLWKPVPELVSILGVDIPQAPDVCLAGIGADSATLSWSRPASNRPVQKYLIQVNGVHVGDSPGNETAITVTGLRPNHFYNLRVVAVGPNSFRAGSPLIRLRTFGKDGRPQLGDSRLPTSFVDPDNPRCESADEGDKHGRSVSSLPMVEAAPVLESSAILPRDSGVLPSQRRNTVNRRHSPSVAGPDQPPARPSEPEMSLAELNDKFEGIRKEIDDTLALYAKDEAESQQQEAELKRDRDRKREILKEKEDHTAQLRINMRVTMELMHRAEKDRAKQEQQLKDKETKKGRIRDSIAKFEMDTERMKRERKSFEAQKKELARERDRDICKLDNENTKLQEDCNQLEAELRDKGKQLQDFKAAREKQSGADEEMWREEDLKLRREWELHRRELHSRLAAETKEGHLLSPQIRDLTEQLKVQQVTGLAFYGQPGSSVADYEPSPAAQPKRTAHNGNPLLKASLPSPDRVPPAEPNLQAAVGFSSASFMPRLFMEPTVDGTNELAADIEFKASGETLSPSAQTLLPSNIFEESEEADAMGSKGSLMPEPKPARAAVEEGPQSPASSNLSFNVFPSPHGSAHNLPFPQYTENGEGKSLNAASSTTETPTAGHKIASFLSTLQRGRAAKCSDAGGPPIGSLKPAQSQSFPSAADEDAMGNRRRINIGSWVVRDSDASDRARPPSAAPIGTSRPLSALRPNPHKGSPVVAVSDREEELSRPASIASTDLPRPSTDSGSIWGAPGDSLALQKNRLWSRGEGPWPSRSGSRRPSLQGSTALTTTLASAEDEILGEDELLNPETLPSQVGVIGSRPPGAAKAMSQRLNPAAPTFMAHIFRKDKDKDKDRSREKAKEEKGKAKEVATSAGDLAPSLDNSPPGSRASRDGHSVHTQVSMSESHESLQLDSTVSNVASDLQSPSASSLKEQDKSVRKLFRKGSSSKFSLSTRLGKDSSLFKKGPGSAGNSDRNTPVEHRSSIGDADDVGDDGAMLGRSFDSLASSSSLGPSKSKESRESGRMSSWRFSMSSIKKKGRDTPAKETEQTTDDG
ncbi:hypothetical protein XA68_15081 [Ophiocordyceps unilateralis]|uniref:Fibronectin type-III domain-containing protein n=1 Tax=Ophiocordyceps unilateralis TaxID=268505 RepID=A0A2A9PMM1_OPHUN|nr:hypothetical protein XA68_15081 [Ophiocordyceps unilateralis]